MEKGNVCFFLMEGWQSFTALRLPLFLVKLCHPNCICAWWILVRHKPLGYNTKNGPFEASRIFCGQSIATVHRRLVTPNGSLVREVSPKCGKHSGLGTIAHTMHVWYTYLYIYHQNQPNVGTYASPMDGMGSNFAQIFVLFFFLTARWSSYNQPCILDRMDVLESVGFLEIFTQGFFLGLVLNYTPVK